MTALRLNLFQSLENPLMPNKRKASQYQPSAIAAGSQGDGRQSFSVGSDTGTVAKLPNPASYSPYNVSCSTNHTFSHHQDYKICLIPMWADDSFPIFLSKRQTHFPFLPSLQPFIPFLPPHLLYVRHCPTLGVEREGEVVSIQR